MLLSYPGASGSVRDLRPVDADTLGISCSELTTVAHLEALWTVFGVPADAAALDPVTPDALPDALARTSAYLTHPGGRAGMSRLSRQRRA